MPDRRRILTVAAVALAGLAVLLLAAKRAGLLGPSPSPARVIALYLDEQVEGPAEPLGLRVAEVAVDERGAASVLRSEDEKLIGPLTQAVAEANALRAMPLAGESRGSEGGTITQGVSEEAVTRRDARYAWALGAFLRQKTGLRYDVLPPKGQKPRPGR